MARWPYSLYTSSLLQIQLHKNSRMYFEQCSWTWLSLAHIRSVPISEPMSAVRSRQSSDVPGWGHIHHGVEGHVDWEWGRGDYAKKKYVLIIKRRMNMQWKGWGDLYLLKCIHASSSCCLKYLLSLSVLVCPSRSSSKNPSSLSSLKPLLDFFTFLALIWNTHPIFLANIYWTHVRFKALKITFSEFLSWLNG